MDRLAAMQSFVQAVERGGFAVAAMASTPSPAVAMSGRLRINNGQALRAAALEGAGINISPNAVVAGDLLDGRLVRRLADYAAPSLPLRVRILLRPNGAADAFPRDRSCRLPGS